MRAVLLAFVFAALLLGSRVAEEPPTITVLLQFDQPHSERSIGEMKRELEAAFRGADLQFRWRLLSDVKQAESFDDVIVVRMKGRCRMEPVPMLMDERGPFAITHSTDGQVLPFSEVACDRIRVSIRSAMRGGDLARGDELLGRALGRVLAHEMVHILAGTHEHGTDGIAKACLSARQLLAEELPLAMRDLARLRR